MAATRTTPHNLEAEASLIGAMLLSRDAIAAATEHIGSAHFYKPAHGHIFEAVLKLQANGEPVDPITVSEELRRMGVLDAIGGPGTLVDLQTSAPAISNAGRYASIIEELALLRAMITTAGEIAELGYSLPDDVSAAIDEAEAKVFALGQGRQTSSVATFREATGEFLERLEMLREAGEDITGLTTGYEDLDGLLSGLQPSTLNVLGARPAMGKTAFALGIASHVAFLRRRPVLVFSLEMSQTELMARFYASEARIDSTKLKNGRLREQDWAHLHRAMDSIADAPLWVDDNPNVSVMEIRSKARKLKSQVGDLGLVIVDYIQLMTGRSGAESRQVEVAEISRGLKILAREIEAPVLALSQLNRSLEQRSDKRPMLADLRESGSLEQDADVVMFLYRDEVYNPGTGNDGLAEVIVAKHRSGPTGTATMGWLGQYTKFVNLARG